MKKSNFLTPVYLFVLLAGCIGSAVAAPFGPDGRKTHWVQPGGATLELRMFGDEYYARTETPAGHTVVRNPADNAYHYAELSADGNALVPSGTLAEEPAPVGQALHLDLPKARILEILEVNRTKYDGGRRERWNQRVRALQQVRAAVAGDTLRRAASKIQPVPVNGNKRGLTILVQFPDDSRTSGADPIDFPVNRNKIVRFCNDVGYTEDGNTGSVRDYFFDQSAGKLTYTQTVTQIITVPRARNYYNFSDYPTNRVLRGDASRVLIADAIAVLQAANFDFTVLTTDTADRAIATNVFFAGPDSGVFAEGLWPQQWNLPLPVSVGTSAKPVYIDKFQITNADDASPVIGTFCHENGHLLLDYPDIYSIFPDGEGVGGHCLMGSGNHLDGGRTPSPINAYFKDAVGWANVTDLTPAEFKTGRLTALGNIAFRIRNPASVTEYFMVENRGDGDKWAKFSEDKGVAIWHIDETMDGNLRGGAHYEVSLEQADGRSDLEKGLNRGDTADLFDLTTPKFNDNTAPNARWWNGARSGIKVEALTGVGSSVSVLFGGVPPNTIIMGLPNGGEVIFPESTYEVTWQANISGNVMIDLLKGGRYKLKIAANEPNDGSFSWTVPASLAAGNDYSIRISTVSNAVPASDTSNAAFEINDATFPAGGAVPYGWFRPSGASTSWKFTDSIAYEGKGCLVSMRPGDGETAGVAYRSMFKAGQVSFYMRVSSEQGYDFARFYIDDVLQSIPGGGAKQGLSGKVGWTYATFPVSKGQHTLKWTYEKDDSYAAGLDSAWLDGVALPETTQEITVTDDKGNDLADGQSTVSFPNVIIGSSSAAKSFTIKNVGKAALQGLKIVEGGASPEEFTVKALGTTVLDPGESTTFKIVFSPTHVGPRTAGIRILSNDSNEGEFSIALEGKGMGIPKIAVFAENGTKLKDDGETRDFGSAVVGSTGKTRTFTIKNQGSADLENLSLSKSGDGRADFKVSALGVTSLVPGATTTFKVTFNPSARDERTAQIQIQSNDKKSGTFELNISGTGAPKGAAAPGSAGVLAATLGNPASADNGQLAAVTTVEVIQGQKYNALTITRQAGNSAAATVEVSPDLLDWYSGRKHTTVLIDEATTLKVRDNTPVTRDAKRYIRLK